MAVQSNIKFVRKPEVLESLGVSNSTLYLRIQQGVFPPPISLGDRAVGWLEHENNTVLTAMIAGSSKGEMKDLVSSLVQSRKAGAQ